MSQRQEFSNNHLPRVPITPNQEGTMELREELLSSVWAQNLDISSYQVSDLEDIEFNWENDQLDLDADFRPSIDTPYSPTTFDDLPLEGSSVENLIVLDGEEDKENAAPSTHVSECPTEPPASWEFERLEQEWKMYQIMLIYIFFNKYYRVCVLI